MGKKVTDEVAKIVNDEWRMKRHTIRQQSRTHAITKDTPHLMTQRGSL